MKPPLNDAQRRAISENWSIYILKGWERTMHHLKPALPRSTYNALGAMIDVAIRDIKEAQAKRRRK